MRVQEGKATSTRSARKEGFDAFESGIKNCLYRPGTLFRIYWGYGYSAAKKLSEMRKV